MAFTNQTTHYGLPLPIGSDKSTWLDNNTAFAAIDAAIYQASTDAAAAAGDISTIQGDITSLQSGKQNVLTFDAAPTVGSTNPVTSSGIYDALTAKQDVITIDATPTTGSNNPVSSNGVFNAVDHVIGTVNSDGVKTYSQLLDAIFAACAGTVPKYIDVAAAGNTYRYELSYYDTTTYILTSLLCDNAGAVSFNMFRVLSSGSQVFGGVSLSMTDNSSLVIPIGTTITIYA